MDEATKAELNAVQAAIGRLEAMIQRLIDREESRISRIAEIEMDMERMRGECRVCKGETAARLADGNLRFRDHEDRIKILQDPETGAVLKKSVEKGRDSARAWIELLKGIAWLVIGAAAAVAVFKK